MVLVIDNYDSFTFNLVQYVQEQRIEVEVYRNDELSPEDVAGLRPDSILLSPGPCRPADAGNSMAIVKSFHEKVPILGVCLGHQAIGEAFGGKVVKAGRIFHGELSEIFHNGDGIFKDMAMPFQATRYHSLVIERESLPPDLKVTAWTSDGVVMGIQHKRFPTFGVQFHPESFATENGKVLVRNFFTMNKVYNEEEA